MTVHTTTRREEQKGWLPYIAAGIIDTSRLPHTHHRKSTGAPRTGCGSARHKNTGKAYWRAWHEPAHRPYTYRKPSHWRASQLHSLIYSPWGRTLRFSQRSKNQKFPASVSQRASQEQTAKNKQRREKGGSCRTHQHHPVRHDKQRKQQAAPGSSNPTSRHPRPPNLRSLTTFCSFPDPGEVEFQRGRTSPPMDPGGPDSDAPAS